MQISFNIKLVVTVHIIFSGCAEILAGVLLVNFKPWNDFWLVYFLTIGNSEICLVVPAGLVSEVLCNVHVCVDLLSHLLQHRAQVILPESFIQELQQLSQLDFSAVVPDLLAVILSILLSETSKCVQISLLDYQNCDEYKIINFIFIFLTKSSSK